AMRPIAVERDRLHAALVDDVGAELRVGLQQKILEASAVELKRRDRREPRRSELDASRQLAVIAVRKKVAEPELLELRGAQMRLEPQSLLKIVRADLDARFADLERRLGHRVLPSFRDEDVQLRRFHPQLAREASAREPASKNRDIVVIGYVQTRHGGHSTSVRDRSAEASRSSQSAIRNPQSTCGSRRTRSRWSSGSIPSRST